MQRFIPIAISFLLAISCIPAFAEPGAKGITHDCASCHFMSDKEAVDMLKPLKLNVKSVKHAPVRGMFEVLAEKAGTEGIIYIDYGKKYLMQGVIVDANKMEAISSHNRTPPPQKKLAVIDTKTIPVNLSVVMGNPNGAKKLYVFTDPDCPYCRKMHAELKKLEKLAPDIAIHIMLYPLPIHPGAYDKARTIVETKNHDLLDKAFDGKEVPKPTKDSSKKSIDEIIKFARDAGIDGTPALVLPDGTVMLGARDAETLKKMLEGK